MSKYIFVALIVIVPHLVLSQEKKWEWINPKLNGNYLWDVSILSDNTLVAAYSDHVLMSSDKGTLWTPMEWTYKVTELFTFGNYSFAVTREGEIVRNILGQSPQVVFKQTGTNPEFFDLSLDAATGIGFAVGGYEVWEPVSNGTEIINWGVILRTTDFGATWNVVYDIEGDQLKGIVRHNGMYTSFGTERWNFALQSTDGITWSRADPFVLYNHYIQQISFVNDQVGFLIFDSHDVVYKTTDGGQTWAPCKNLSQATYHMSANGQTVAVSTYSQIFVSDDLGVSWTEIPASIDGLTITSIKNKGTMVLAQDQVGGLYLRQEGAAEFIQLNDNMNRWLISGDRYFVGFRNNTIFTSGQVGYTAINTSDYWSKLYKTTDGGCHWNALEPTGYQNFYSNSWLYFLNDEVGFALTGFLYKTEDGGNSWNKCSIPSAEIAEIGFFNSQVGIAISTDKFFRSADGGANWTEVNKPFIPIGTGVKLFNVNETTAFVVMSNDKILKTTDAGSTWTQHTIGMDMWWTSLHFFDSQNGIIAGNKDVFVNNAWTAVRYVAKTSDGGLSWSKVADLPDDPLTMQFVSPTEGYIGGKEGMFVKSIDGGMTWNEEKTIVKQWITDIFSYDNELFVIGDNHSIAKTFSDLPIADFQMNESWCQFDTLVAVNNSVHAKAYVWKIDGVEVSRDPVLNFPMQNAGSMKVQLTGGTCNLSHYSQQELQIEIKPAPEKPEVFVNERQIVDLLKLCPDSVYHATTSFYSGYQWSNGSTQSAVTLSDESKLAVKVFGVNGCSISSDTTRVVRLPNPTVKIEFNLIHGTDKISFSSVAGEGISIYKWDLGDGTTSDLPAVVHEYSDKKIPYTVQLIGKSYCGADTATVVVDYLILPAETGTANSNVFPNPVNSSGRVTLESVFAQQYQLHSASGTILVSRSIDGSVIDLPALSPGVYVLYLLRGNRKISVNRLVVR